jgi:hypothetical protein
VGARGWDVCLVVNAEQIVLGYEDDLLRELGEALRDPGLQLVGAAERCAVRFGAGQHLVGRGTRFSYTAFQKTVVSQGRPSGYRA